MKTAIIVGASSGIGQALAKILAKDGYRVGLVARRVALLQELHQAIGQQAVIKPIDIADTSEAIAQFAELIQELGDVDLIVISAGVGFINPELDWAKERDTIAVNVTGFAAIANVAMQYFLKQERGHLTNISSIAALRGSGEAPAYNASKAFESNYLAGLRHKVAKLRLPIAITDIQPGFVDTAMAQGEGLFWVASPDEAARQIYRAIQRHRKHAYVTRRWRIIAWLLKLVPDAVYHRL